MSIERIVARRLVHQLVAERLVERVFNQPLIGNVERGQYVECMIELALSDSRPPWSLTATWDAWDLVQQETGARIEVKQSAYLQTWSNGDPDTTPRASFDIRARSGYSEDGSKQQADWRQTSLMRQADIYVMAWHGETDSQIADHRDPNQWQFFVVREADLPRQQKTISLNPLKALASPLSLNALPDEVVRALDGLPLKSSGNL